MDTPMTKPTIPRAKRRLDFSQIKVNASVGTQTMNTSSSLSFIRSGLQECLEEQRRLRELCESQNDQIDALREALYDETSARKWEEEQRMNLEEEISSVGDELEEWIGRTLKHHWLVNKMKDIGGCVPAAEDIFGCFDDIEIPEVPLHIREKYIPGEITGAVSDEEEGEEQFDEPVTMTRAEFSDYMNLSDEERANHWRITINDNGILREVSPQRYLLYYREEIAPHSNEPFQGFNSVTRYEDTTVYHDEWPPLPWYEARYPTPTEESAAITIQDHFRRRMNCIRERENIEIWKTTYERVILSPAANEIQRFFRGYLCRRKTSRLRTLRARKYVDYSE